MLGYQRIPRSDSTRFRFHPFRANVMSYQSNPILHYAGEFLTLVRKVVGHPICQLVIGLCIAASALAEIVASIKEGRHQFGTHHGMIVFGLGQIFLAMGDFREALQLGAEALEEVNLEEQVEAIEQTVVAVEKELVEQAVAIEQTVDALKIGLIAAVFSAAEQPQEVTGQFAAPASLAAGPVAPAAESPAPQETGRADLLSPPTAPQPVVQETERGELPPPIVQQPELAELPAPAEPAGLSAAVDPVRPSRPVEVGPDRLVLTFPGRLDRALNGSGSALVPRLLAVRGVERVETAENAITIHLAAGAVPGRELLRATAAALRATQAETPVIAN